MVALHHWNSECPAAYIIIIVTVARPQVDNRTQTRDERVRDRERARDRERTRDNERARHREREDTTCEAHGQFMSRTSSANVSVVGRHGNPCYPHTSTHSCTYAVVV